MRKPQNEVDPEEIILTAAILVVVFTTLVGLPVSLIAPPDISPLILETVVSVNFYMIVVAFIIHLVKKWIK